MNQLLMPRRIFLLTAIVVSVLLPGRVHAAVIGFSGGHGDVRLTYENNDFQLKYGFGEGSILNGVNQPGGTELRLEPSDVYTRVGPNLMTTTNAPIPWLSTQTGDPIWFLPASSPPPGSTDTPWLGVDSSDLNDAGAPLNSLVLSMTDYNGPDGGEFALWLNNGTVFWQTNDGIGVNPSDDQFSMGLNTHDHFNWGFTAEGIYQVEITATANLNGGGTVSDTEIFTFAVGTTAIPEPGSLALLVGISVSVFVVRRRGKKRGPINATSPRIA